MPSRGGVIHCFTGNRDAAREFVALGFHISFSGIVTFRNAREIQQAAPTVPDDRVMVETDAPYLAPEPYRGKRNEPAYVRRTLEVLATLRGVEADRARDDHLGKCAAPVPPRVGGEESDKTPEAQEKQRVGDEDPESDADRSGPERTSNRPASACIRNSVPLWLCLDSLPDYAPPFARHSAQMP